MFDMLAENQNLRSFIKVLDDGSQKDIELILSNANREILANVLKSMENFFITSHDEGFNIIENPLPERFYMLLVKVIDWERISSEPKYSCVYTIVYLLSKLSVVCSSVFIENDIVKALVKILKEEHISGVAISSVMEGGQIINTAKLISTFLPALPSSPSLREVDNHADEILFSGHCFEEDDEEETEEEILMVLRSAFSPVYKICRRTNCLPIHKVLLLKMIYWANAVDVLDKFITVRQLVCHIKSCIFAKEVHNVIIGTEVVHALASKYSTIFNDLKVQDAMQNVRSLLSDGRHEWMIEFYDLLSSTEQNEEQRHLGLIRYCFGNETYSITLHLRSKLIRLMLDYILPHVKDGTNAKYDMKLCYSRLRNFIEIVLDLPKNSMKYRGPLNVPPEGIESCKHLVSYIVKVIDELGVLDNDDVEFAINFDEVQDLKELPFISLGLYHSLSLCSIIDASKQLVELRSSPMAQALILLSLIHEVNENWGLLFCTLTPERLIDISCFGSIYFERSMSERLDLCIDGEIDSPVLFENTVTSYPFLLSYHLRKEIFYHFMSLNRDISPREFCITNVPRRNLFEFLEENVQRDQMGPWDIFNIKFAGEIGSGPGLTKEFYSVFSKECQREDLNVWIGDATNGGDGMIYTSSTCGLFPLPNRLARTSTLDVIGNFMAKSIWDHTQLDIHLSPAFYKASFDFRGQSPILNDIKNVVPNVYKFVKCLVNALREKYAIREDENLTPEERLKAISEITCDGSSFNDLFLNFTIPGFPDIEMMKGGCNTDLNIDNLELYLRLLTWWLFHSNSRTTCNRIRTAFQTYLPIQCLKSFYPEEIERLMCGVTVENWTVDYLKECCHLNSGLSVGSPCVQHLFEILSSLSPSDQRLFLQFVTSSPRLPFGGLKNLDPPLTIACSGLETSLPTSRTCFNTLLISDSVSKEVLEEKLLLAIKEGSGSFQFV